MELRNRANYDLQRQHRIVSILERDAIARHLAAIRVRSPRTASLRPHFLLFSPGPPLHPLRLLFPSFLVAPRLTLLYTKDPKKRSTGANVRSVRTGASMQNLKESSLPSPAPFKEGR